MNTKAIGFIGLMSFIGLMFLGTQEKKKNEYGLPEDLLFKGKPISDSYMNAIVPILCGAAVNIEVNLEKPLEYSLDEEDEYEWKYIDTLASGDHLIYGYLWPAHAMGKFAEIAVVRRVGNKLKALSHIAGGDRHATMIAKNFCSVENDIVTYKQHMTTGLLHDLLLNQLPDLKSINDTKNHDELFWGEADFIGVATMQVAISEQGIAGEPVLTAFTPAEGGPINGSDEADEWITKIEKNSLTMGSALILLLDYYACRNKRETLNLAELQSVLIEACAYAKEI